MITKRLAFPYLRYVEGEMRQPMSNHFTGIGVHILLIGILLIGVYSHITKNWYKTLLVEYLTLSSSFPL